MRSVSRMREFFLEEQVIVTTPVDLAVTRPLALTDARRDEDERHVNISHTRCPAGPVCGCS